MTTRCHCLSGETYDACCGPLHQGVPAPTAERLMRSRYSAFAVGDAGWLLETWHPSTRPDDLELDPAVRWFRLDVLRTERGGPLDDRGVVEFAAHSRVDGAAEVQREVSRFVRDRSRRWLYVDGVPG